MITDLGAAAAAGLGGVSLLLAGAGVYAAESRARVHRERLAGIVSAYAPVAVASTRGGLRLIERTRSIVDARVLALLAVSPDRPDLYPLRWWVLVLLSTFLSILVVGIAVGVLGPVAWAVLPALWFFSTRALFRYFERRRSAVLYNQLPDALAMIGRSIRSGITVQDALKVVADEGLWPTSKEFQRLHDEIRLGSSLAEALVRLAQRSALIEYRFFAVALALQSQSGGSLSETLENLADVIRRRVALGQRALALAAEARTSIYVLTALPFLTALALLFIAPAYLIVLIDTSIGRRLLLLGFILLGMGLFSMHTIIKKSLA
jgi:tight adherence protein B